MKTLKIAIPILLIALVAWGMFQTSQPAPPLASVMPEGALLYVESKDFGTILNDWNSSPEKQAWLKSDALSVFSRSRLYLRLKDAQEQFGEVAGLKPDMNFLGASSGSQTALAWYDIGKLEMLYVSRTSSAKAMQNALWKSKAKFETRKVGTTEFYVRKNPQTERQVAFAIVDDYLVIGTREDLVAGAVQSMTGQAQRTLQQEEWFTRAIGAAREPGDLRMVLNMTKIVPSSYFRTYWVQQNITNLGQYASAVVDLHREPQRYREERVMLRNEEKQEAWTAAKPEDSKLVPELTKLVPEGTGFYRASTAPNANTVLDSMVVKVLSPHLGAAPVQKLAPRVSLGGGETGSESDLETRIDQAPSARTNSEESTSKLRKVLEANAMPAMLVMHSTDTTPDGVFVNLRSCIAVLGSDEWKPAEVREALAAVVRPGMTVAELGTTWQAHGAQGTKYEQLDGLSSIAFATRGKLLVLANNPQDVAAVLERASTPAKDAAGSYVAAFQHAQERGNFMRLVNTVDRNLENPGERGEHEPRFFSENIGSISRMYSGVKSEKIVEVDEGEMVKQTVIYEWSR